MTVAARGAKARRVLSDARRPVGGLTDSRGVGHGCGGNAPHDCPSNVRSRPVWLALSGGASAAHGLGVQVLEARFEGTSISHAAARGGAEAADRRGGSAPQCDLLVRGHRPVQSTWSPSAASRAPFQ